MGRDAAGEIYSKNRYIGPESRDPDMRLVPVPMQIFGWSRSTWAPKITQNVLIYCVDGVFLRRMNEMGVWRLIQGRRGKKTLKKRGNGHFVLCHQTSVHALT